MMAESLSILMLALIFLVAALYASVGHGGASGYLAIMSLFAFSPQQMAGTALVLNLFVSGLAFWSYARAGHALPNFSWLLIIAALPVCLSGRNVAGPSAVICRFIGDCPDLCSATLSVFSSRR
jgi:uncharacterized membrane protein YfcA